MNRYRPSYEEFARRLDSSASCIPVYRQLTGDGLTPVSAFRRIERTAPSFLFESVIGGEKVGRFSFLGTEPFLRFEARGREVTHRRDRPRGRGPPVHLPTTRSPSSKRLLERYRAAPMPGLPRFAGGAVGFAAYDAVRYTEDLPDVPPDDRGLPDLSFAFYDRMVLFDHIRKTDPGRRPGARRPVGGPRRPPTTTPATGSTSWSTAWPRPAPDLGVCDIDTDAPPTLEFRSNFTRERYEEVVRHCQEYIKAGDIFQVVPSQRFQVETRGRPVRHLPGAAGRQPQPVPVLPAVRRLRPDRQLAGDPGAGRGGHRDDPPAGRDPPPGPDEEEDRALAEELLADPKERAEHIMLVDLGRNDVGRVAEYGDASSSPTS